MGFSYDIRQISGARKDASEVAAGLIHKTGTVNRLVVAITECTVSRVGCTRSRKTEHRDPIQRIVVPCWMITTG